MGSIESLNQLVAQLLLHSGSRTNCCRFCNRQTKARKTTHARQSSYKFNITISGKNSVWRGAELHINQQVKASARHFALGIAFQIRGQTSLPFLLSKTHSEHDLFDCPKVDLKNIMH